MNEKEFRQKINKIAKRIIARYGFRKSIQLEITMTIMSIYELHIDDIYAIRNTCKNIIKKFSMHIDQYLINILKPELPEIMGEYMTHEEWSKHFFKIMV